MLTADQIRREFGVEFDTSGKVSQFAGLAPFLAFLERAGVKPRLERLFDKYSASAMLQLMIGIIAGSEDMEEVARVGQDNLVRKYLKRPVSETQVTRNLERLSAADIEKLHEFVMSVGVTDLVSHLEPDEVIELDVDATSKQKYGKQEGVEKGYIEKNKIEDCYQYLFFRLANINSFLYGTIRGGAAHSQNGFLDYLRRLLPKFSGRAVKMRVDSGYYNEEAFDICSTYNTTIYVKAPMTISRKNQAQNKDIVWAKDPENEGIEFGSYITNTSAGVPYREVFKRTPLDAERNTLFADYRYDCVATNNFKMGEKNVFKEYNPRANIENNIRELKNSYKLGHIVTNKFATNDIITQVTILGYVLMQHFKRLALDDKMQRMQLSTLRWRVFNIPGSLLKGARKSWHRLHNSFLKPEKYMQIFTRLKHRLSAFFIPPEVSLLSTA